MNILKKEDEIVINKVLTEFEESLKHFKRNSADALALVIFINGCYDTQSFASNKYSALVHYQQARKSAKILEPLLNKSTHHFNKAIRSAQSILIGSNIVHPDLVLEG